MDLKAKKSFSNGYTGNVHPGQMLYDVPHHVAVHFVENDLCEFVGARAADNPLANGPANASLSSPAGQVSHQNTVNTSASGESKAPAEQSQSTQPASAPRGQTQSTPTTGHGGSDTPKKRRGRPKKSQGTTGQR